MTNCPRCEHDLDISVPDEDGSEIVFCRYCGYTAQISAENNVVEEPTYGAWIASTGQDFRLGGSLNILVGDPETTKEEFIRHIVLSGMMPVYLVVVYDGVIHRLIDADNMWGDEPDVPEPFVKFMESLED